MNLLERIVSTAGYATGWIAGICSPSPVTEQPTDVKRGETVDEGRVMMYVYLIAMSIPMVASIIYQFIKVEWKVTLWFVLFCHVLVFTPLALNAIGF